MYKHILIATDGSELRRDGVAARLCRLPSSMKATSIGCSLSNRGFDSERRYCAPWSTRKRQSPDAAYPRRAQYDGPGTGHQLRDSLSYRWRRRSDHRDGQQQAL